MTKISVGRRVGRGGRRRPLQVALSSLAGQHRASRKMCVSPDSDTIFEGLGFSREGWIGLRAGTPQECGAAATRPKRRAGDASAPPARVHQSSTVWKRLERVNDPSAGSPTETLLRLLLPLSDQIWSTSANPKTSLRNTHQATQSVAATGGVYKGQGRNQCKLMTCVY